MQVFFNALLTSSAATTMNNEHATLNWIQVSKWFWGPLSLRRNELVKSFYIAIDTMHHLDDRNELWETDDSLQPWIFWQKQRYESIKHTPPGQTVWVWRPKPCVFIKKSTTHFQAGCAPFAFLLEGCWLLKWTCIHIPRRLQNSSVYKLRAVYILSFCCSLRGLSTVLSHNSALQILLSRAT